MTQIAMIYLITFWSGVYGIDSKVAISVAQHESSFNVNAVGAIGEEGIFQIRPEFAKQYTKKQLFNPEINIMLGVQRLKEAKDKCIHKGKQNYLVCYNMGMTAAKKIKHPSQFPYVVAVNKLMGSI